MKIPVLFVLAAIVSAGCLGGGPDGSVVPAGVKSSAEEAGAVSGPAPAAPKEAYQVAARDLSSPESEDDAVTTAFPVILDTNAARAPERREFRGAFNASECSPVGNLNPTASSFRPHPITDLFQPGDVYSYRVNLTWTNTDDSWGEIHLFYGIGSKNEFSEGSTANARGEQSAFFEGQGYRVKADDPAWTGVACWYGSTLEPIEYLLTVEVSYAQDSVPAETPVLVVVPENATRLIVRGVAVDSSQGVLSHYRVFDPEDKLVCECALSSADEAASLPVAGGGDYVVLVDHTSNGFVSLALDAPSPESLRPLQSAPTIVPLVASDGGAVDKVVQVEIPSVPLSMWSWVRAPGSDANAGFAKQLNVVVTNERGTPVTIKWAGFANYRVPTPQGVSQNFVGLPVPGDWEFTRDHHAYAPGAHSVHVSAEALRGETVLLYVTYVR